MATNNNNKPAQEKQFKNYCKTFRVTKQQSDDINKMITDESGKKLISISELAVASIFLSTINIIDTDVERYKIVAINKLGNVINQFNKQINIERKSGTLSEDTYRHILSELRDYNQELRHLVQPLKL